jgi:hypothetical protein
VGDRLRLGDDVAERPLADGLPPQCGEHLPPVRFVQIDPPGGLEPDRRLVDVGRVAGADPLLRVFPPVRENQTAPARRSRAAASTCR